MNTPRHWELLKDCLIYIWNCARSVLPTFGTAQKVSYRHWLGHDDACNDGTSANTLTFLQREWGKSAQPLRKPKLMLPFPTAR
jgi:hypothetical protein